MQRLTLAQARRLALAAQGLGRPRPPGRIDRGHVRGLFARVGVVQIDSVNVLVRSHYLPGWSRLGGYPRPLLDRFVHGDHEAFEYWAHEASLVPVALYPLLRWRMERAARGVGVYSGLVRIAKERPDYVEAVLREVEDGGPLSASQLSEPGSGSGPWWGWGDGKRALEWLFWTGQVTVAERRASFERVYDVPERVLPPAVLAAPVPGEDTAQRALLRLAAASLGVATAADLGDYFRLPAADTKARVAELVEDGDLLPVHVAGWRSPAYMPPGRPVPRRVAGRAVLSPFDPLVWHRPRTERLFDFELRLEFYTPPERRRHGYYVLPFLYGDRLAARVDLKSDRAAGVLRVPGAFAEPHAAEPAARAEVAAALREELCALAAWLELDRVEVGSRGDLAAALRGRPAAAPAASPALSAIVPPTSASPAPAPPPDAGQSVANAGA